MKTLNTHLISVLTTVLLIVGLLLIGCAPKKVIEQKQPSKPKIEKPFVPTVPLTTTKGLAVTAHPLASQVAAKILKSGGNAASAGLAGMAALSVVEPHASGLGGGGFALYYDAKAKTVGLVDYRETAPRGVVADTFYQPTDTFRLRLQTGGSAVLVPGAPKGWQRVWEKYANRSVTDLLQPAIVLADSGYPTSAKQKTMILEHEDLSENETLASLYFSRDDDLKVVPHGKIQFKALAETYRELAKMNSFAALSSPPFSSSIVATVQKAGGALSLDDMEQFRPIERKPLHIRYRGYDIYTLPMPSAGGVAVALAMRMLEQTDIQKLGWQSPELLHTVAEAIRQGMTDGYVWGGDPDYVTVRTDSILGDNYVKSAWARIPQDSTRERAAPYDTATSHGNTTHLVVADDEGNLLSVTQSINYFFGSKVFNPATGVLLNNHCADYDWRPGRRNSIAPGKRPSSWMAPLIVLKDGKPFLVAGTPGGPRIPAVMVQLLVDLIDFGMPLNQAMDAPRFMPNGKNFEYEPRFPAATIAAIEKKGWKLKAREPGDNYFGGAQAILFQSDGSKVGVGDTRRDGSPSAAE
ncbi:MAG: gamma-glutamyltransferase [bacterium]|nr:gamma-glutamyltransferase [bacterium]